MRSSNKCIYKQLFVTAAIFKTIRHKIYLKTLKHVRYSKQKSKSRSETSKIPSSVSYATKLKFVEIVMIFVSFSTQLSYPWGYTILVSTACPLWKKSIIYVGNVYNKTIEIITLIIVLPGSTRL